MAPSTSHRIFSLTLSLHSLFDHYLVIMSASISFFLASFLSSVVDPRQGKHSLSAVAALVTLGYMLIFLAAQFLVPAWGMSPFLVALFILGLAMGLLSALLLPKALEEVAPHDAGAASGVYTTVSQIAGAFGVALIGLLDASLTASSGNPLRAFIISVLVIVLLSSGLSLSVLPLAGSRPPTTENEALMHEQELAHEQKEETEQVHPREEGACLSCQNA